MKSINSLILLLSLSIFIACSGNSDSSNTSTSSESTEQTDKPKAEKKKTQTIIKVDGIKAKEAVIPDIGDNSYDITVTLKDTDTSTDFESSDTTPPMPFNIGGWTLMKKSENTYFVYNANIKAGTNVEFGKGWHTLRIIAKKDENRTSFFVDGENSSTKDFFTPLGSNLTLGKGYKSRFWKGEFKKLVVKDLTSNKVVFDRIK